MNDKYIFETESSREMELVSSRHKIMSVLEEIKNILIMSLKKQKISCQRMNMD